MSARRDWRPGGSAPYWFLAPLLAFTAVFLVLPLGFSVWLAFTRWNPLSEPRWVGTRQFEHLLLRDDAFRESLANTFTFAFAQMAIGVPLALMAGRWSDRHDRPIVPLLVATILASVGLLAMALVESLAAAKASYLVFGIAGAVFLSLHSAQTLRVLPRPHTRGRDLGIFNLTNTVPSLLMPWIAIGIIPLAGFSGLFAILAGLAILATLLLASLLRRI